MLQELLKEKGYLQFIGFIKDNKNNEEFYLLSINDEPFSLENKELATTVSFFSSAFKEESFYIIKKNNIVEKKDFFKEVDLSKLEYEVKVLPTELTNKKVEFSLEDDVIYIKSEDEYKMLAIDIKTLKNYEEKEDVRIIRGFLMDTVSEISLDDIRSTAGNNMMLKSMNAIVSKKIDFNDFEVVDNVDVYEGDIISIIFENNRKETGMLLYDFTKQSYILKQSNNVISLTHNKQNHTIKKIKLEQTFLEAQTDTFGQAIYKYFNEYECKEIMSNIFKCEAISLGIGSLLSLVKEPNEVDFIMENIILNGLNAEDIKDFLDETIVNDDKTFTIIPSIPFVNFIYLT